MKILKKNVPNMAFDHKKDTYYIYRLINNKDLFQDFKPLMDNTLGLDK